MSAFAPVSDRAMNIAGGPFAKSGHSITAHSANPIAIHGRSCSKTQSSDRTGDLGRILFVGGSAPAGVTDRDVRDTTTFAFACSHVSQGNDPPPLKLKKCHFVKRAPDCRLRNPLGSRCRDKMEGLGDVYVRPSQIPEREGCVNHGVESDAG